MKDERTAGATCTRARELVSLQLDTEISELEGALLVVHLDRCPGCRRFADEVASYTVELRAAALEPPPQSITVHALRARRRYVVRSAAAAAVLAAGLWGVIGALDLSSESGSRPGSHGQLLFRSQDEQQRFVRSQELRLEPRSSSAQN